MVEGLVQGRPHWDAYHAGGKPNHLTGTPFQALADYLDLHGYARPGKAVLVIGVGLGYCSRGFADAGANVYALDISPRALDRVRGFAAGVFLPEQIGELGDGIIDAAYSTSVTQHMSVEQLRDQFRNVFRVLKGDGVFRVHFVEHTDETQNDNVRVSLHARLGGRAWYSRKFATALIAECGGEVTHGSEGVKVMRTWGKKDEYVCGYWLGCHRA